jgi:hypothetical protein
MSPRSWNGWGNNIVNAYSIDFSPLLPTAGLAVAGTVAVIIILLCATTRPTGGLWRIAATVLLLILLLRPTLVSELRDPLKDVAVIAVDRSPSTKVAGRDGEISAALDRLRKQLSVYAKTLEVREFDIEHETIGDSGEGTLLYRRLVEAFGDVPINRVAGAIILSDGQIHDIPKRLKYTPLKAPVHVLLAGTPNMRDRRLVVVNTPAYGIVGKAVTITLRIDDPGKELSEPAIMKIRRDGEDFLQKTLPIGRDVPVSVTLEHGGPTVLEFSVSRGKDELTVENNRAVLSINGVRDRLKVLLVSGEPHPGERTWRNLLKSDPSVDLVHFTILRPPEKQDGTPINELSLISFPTRELFEVKLEEFDLVIFDRYRRRGVLPPVYLQNIVDYVENGGALLEAVGPSFAGPFSIYRTPLGTLLPGEPTGIVIDKPFRPNITTLGARHPVTAGLTGTATGETPSWGRWLRQIDVAVKRGNVLMTGADSKPLLVLDRFGKGRVAQFNSDHIWLWARGFEGGGPQAELLKRLAHWLMKEPELEENDLRMTFDGERLRIERRQLEEPKERRVQLNEPNGKKRDVKLEDDTGGRSIAYVPVKRAGLYTVRDGNRTALSAVGALNPKEFSDLRSTRERLHPLAMKTGGHVSWLRDQPVDIRRVRRTRSTSGNNWLGLWRNESYVITGLLRVSLLPPLLALFLAGGLIAIMWRREGI